VSFLDRLDAEHRSALDNFPLELDLTDIPAMRQAIGQLMAAAATMAPEIPGINVTDHDAPGPEGAPDVMVRV